ncbi:nitric oxide synthase-like isoform X2 [Leptidea sinapis]|uniref:nitric oxide synthase-like isoform X2 n=1 Tax=Leptidea sinapis TaxID=189913 RepID=UPI0021299C5E|nr:nitric oxide synthase-like isoform X2 [Leptidea sinapis]
MSDIFKNYIKEAEFSKNQIKSEHSPVVMASLDKNKNSDVDKGIDTIDHVNGYGGCPFNGEKLETSEHDKRQVKTNLRLKVPQPLRLKNHMFCDENIDTLHSQIEDVTHSNTKCSEKICQGSIMDIPGRGNTLRNTDEVFKDAQTFITQYFCSIRRENSDAHMKRVQEIEKELHRSQTYQLKTAELVFGAKLAWRNAARCIGRIQWKKLQIFDCREVTTARGMFEALCNHIKYATNKGNIRSAITIFPQRTDGKHDYRIWNPQLISYAGYTQPDGTVIGDPSKVEFTEVCIQLGWKPSGTPWDILPLVLSADGRDPEFFELPREIVMEVEMEHPKYEWFKELGIRWYALPAVSNMRLDCGGLEFTATAFNGWYMGTEIGCRNLCDSNRLNIVEAVANRMGLDTSSYVSLWKDKALVEVNVAVLHSFHRDNASIVDHHSASEQFIKHLDNENKSRGGCPSDWIWIVPPLSSSLTAVFHQEMALYYIRPSYDYQEPAWKTHQWTKSEGNKSRRKFHFKQIARAVKFTSKLFSQALSKRIKATILYATETGKSEQYAKELGTIFGYAFNAQVHCMSDYDMFSIEHETLLLIVTSTFGNGEPPANGVTFAEHLFQMLYNEKKDQSDQQDSAGMFKTPTPKSLMRSNSVMTPRNEYKRQLSRLESSRSNIEYKRQLSRLESNKSNIAGTSSAENIGPLSNVCFAVFALGSSVYPKFCCFGKTVDRVLEDLGGDRLMEVTCGDEMYGQEQEFRSWSSNIFHTACETFCIEENDVIKDAKKSVGMIPITKDTVRLIGVERALSTKTALEESYKKHLIKCKVVDNKSLGEISSDRATIFVDMEVDSEIKYDPGDHIGIMASNRKEIVDIVLSKLKEADMCDKPVQLQVMKETLTPMGAVKTWEKHERLPAVTIRELFTRFLDITTPPSTKVLKYLASVCSDKSDAECINELLEDSNKYDDWRYHYYPHLGEILTQIPSCKPQTSILAALLPPLQPRFYSISSSPLAHPQRIHITVAVVIFKTQNGEGSTHYGVCSNYLQSLQPGDEVIAFIRRAPNFHMPSDISAPLILIGPGSGIAPFRGFWHHRRYQIKQEEKKAGPMWLFFGCRYKGMDLYKDEKAAALEEGILSKAMVAFSREKSNNKKHVQALLEDEGATISQMLIDKGGHFYVCGDCKMAEEVQQKLKEILKTHGKLSDSEVDEFILFLMEEHRYHEDIFGITLRTSVVHTASRETAKRTRLESGQSQT